jgi:hypothetical protein
MASTFTEVILVYSANTTDADLQMVEISPIGPKSYNLSASGLVSGAPYSFQLQVTDISGAVVSSNTMVISAPWSLTPPTIQSYVGHDSSVVVKLADTVNQIYANDTTVEFLLKRADNSLFWCYLPFSQTGYYTLDQSVNAYLVNNTSYRIAASFQPLPTNTRYMSPSLFSPTITVIPSNTPNVATGITSSSVGFATLDMQVSWSRPSDFAEWSGTNYVIQISQEPSMGTPVTPIVLTNTDATSTVFADIQSGRTYRAHVQYSNVFGTGPDGVSSGWQALTERPDAPSIVSAVDGDSQTTVSFTAPAYDGQSPLDHYNVYKDGFIVATLQTYASHPGGVYSCNIGGLTNGNTYSFSVTCTNAIGQSIPSASLSSTPYGSVQILSSSKSGNVLQVQVNPNGRPLTQLLMVGLSMSPSVTDGSPVISIPQGQLSQVQNAPITIFKTFTSMQTPLDFYAIVVQTASSSTYVESR